MASIKDVAREAGVAASTVSRALNGTGYVSEDARDRIAEAMQRLHYVPNELARNLFRNQSNIVGVMVPDIAHPFFGTFARYAETELYRMGYQTMLCSAVEKSSREQDYLDMLERQVMDGVILGTHTPDLSAYQSIQRPLVGFDRMVREGVPTIGADHWQGGALAAEQVLRGGCRSAVQIMGARTVSTPAHLHHESFRKTLEARGIEVFTVEMEWNRFDFPYYLSVAQETLRKYPGVEAVFAADMLICACIQAAREFEIRIPEDLKLIAYDGTYILDLLPIRVTAIVQPVRQLAKAAVSAVVDLVQKRQGSPQSLLPVSLRLGETT